MIGWYASRFWDTDPSAHPVAGSRLSFRSSPGSPSPPNRRRLRQTRLICRSSCPVRIVFLDSCRVPGLTVWQLVMALVVVRFLSLPNSASAVSFSCRFPDLLPSLLAPASDQRRRRRRPLSLAIAITLASRELSIAVNRTSLIELFSSIVQVGYPG